MIQTGWDIIEDYYLIPPDKPVAETIAMVHDLKNEIALRRRNIDANHPLPMRKLWIGTEILLQILILCFVRTALS